MDKMKFHVFRRLWRGGYVGRRHTAREEMKKGLPKELRDMKLINSTIDNLIKDGYLLKHHGSRISISMSRFREVDSMLAERDRKLGSPSGKHMVSQFQ